MPAPGGHGRPSHRPLCGIPGNRPARNGPGWSLTPSGPRRVLRPGLQRLQRASWPVRLVILALVSALFVVVLSALGAPASGLLGPLLAALVLACSGLPVPIPGEAQRAGQAVVGCMIAGIIEPRVLLTLPSYAPEILTATAMTLLVTFVIVTLTARLRVFDVQTLAWGLLPGGASAMIVMSEESDADVRMVAIMQYMRVIVVALSAAGIAWIHPVAGAGPGAGAAVELAARAPASPLFTLLIVAAGLLVNRFVSLPAGALVLPILMGVVFEAQTGLQVNVPAWAIWLGFAAIGWSVGMRFRADLLRPILRLLPVVLLINLALVAVSAVGSFVVSAIFGIGYTTAFLAMCPGAMDTVAIVARDLDADMGFILSAQFLRMLVVILVVPPLVRRFLLTRQGAG